MKRTTRLLATLTLTLLAANATSCQTTPADPIQSTITAIDNDCTAIARRHKDSLLAIEPKTAEIYGALARIHRHELGKLPKETPESDLAMFKMCVFHMAGKQLDSAALVAYYNSVTPGLAHTMEREATETAAEMAMDRMMGRMDAAIDEMIDSISTSTRHLMRSIQESAPTLVRQIERVLDAALDAFDKGMRTAIRALEDSSRKKEQTE